MLWLFFLIFSEKYTGLRAVFSSISGKLSNCRLTDTFSPSTARFECGNRPSLDYVLGVFFFFFFKDIHNQTCDSMPQLQEAQLAKP